MTSGKVLLVEHKVKGTGYVVDRICHMNGESFIVLLGVAYHDEKQSIPAIHYEAPEDLEQLDVLDFVDDEEEEEEEEEEDNQGGHAIGDDEESA